MKKECDLCLKEVDISELSSCLGYLVTELSPIPATIKMNYVCEYLEDKFPCSSCINHLGFCSNCQKGIPLSIQEEISKDFK